MVGTQSKSGPDIERLVIRPEAPADRVAIRTLLTAAFGQNSEAELVDQLRADGDLSQAWVAETGEIVGYVALSRLVSPALSLALAPLAVAPGDQRRGIGGALMRRAIAASLNSGVAMIFVLGDPDYYARFGFSAQAAIGFECAYSGPYFMALALAKDPIEPGSVVYADAFSGLE